MAMGDTLEVTQLILNCAGSSDIKTGDADPDNDFDIIARHWVTDDNRILRNWTAEEYAEYDPYKERKIIAQITGAFVSPNTRCYSLVKAHCVESRRVYARKQGRKLFSFYYAVDYSKQ